MIQDLLIIGAGGDGRNIADLVASINTKERKWNLLGYLDDDPLKQDSKVNDVPVLGTLRDVVRYDGCFFVTTFGSPKNNFSKKRIIDDLRIPMDRFATLIHPGAAVSPYAKIGRDTIIYVGTYVGTNTFIGDHVKILANCDISHDDVIYDFTTIAHSVSVSGEVTIKEGCYLGSNSSVRERLDIGEWSLIGLGAVIVSDVPPYSIIVGNPGRVIRRRDPSDFQLTHDGQGLREDCLN